TTLPTTVGKLTAVITTDGGSSGAAVQVATLVAAPTVTASTTAQHLSITNPTITITGTGFDLVGTNTVQLSNNAVGTVVVNSATLLTVTLTPPPSVPGPLTAVVTTDGGTSGPPKQVANLFLTPPLTASTANVAINSKTFTFAGTGFDTTPGTMSVVL